MLIICGSTVVIFGFAALAVDFGLLTIDKNRTQRGVDAAALAGAQELTDTAKARAMAIAVAGENGVTVVDAGIAFLDEDTKIRVTASNERNLYFARVIGIPTGTVGASALAGITPGNSINYPPPPVVPIGVTESTVQNYTLPTLNTSRIFLDTARVQVEDYGLNDFVVFDLKTGAAPPQMMRQLINGTTVEIGEFHRSLNANESTIEGFFAPALAARFLSASLPPWLDTWLGNLTASVGSQYEALLNGTALPDNPRVVNLVVTPEKEQTSGIAMHEIKATVPVYLESWTNDELVIRFLPADIFEPASGGSGSNGIRPVSLLQ